MGVNLIDTAPAYGDSEKIGKAIAKTRDKWIISTKQARDMKKKNLLSIFRRMEY